MPSSPLAIAVVGAIGAVASTMAGTVIAWILHRLTVRMERIEGKIDGITNGTPAQVKIAMAQLLKERTLGDLHISEFGRRPGDVKPSIDDPYPVIDTP